MAHAAGYYRLCGPYSRATPAPGGDNSKKRPAARAQGGSRAAGVRRPARLDGLAGGPAHGFGEEREA